MSGHRTAASWLMELSRRSDVLHHSSLRTLVVAAAVLVLLALNVAYTYSLGHHERMYDNPIYRWRESLAIALSRMQTPPLQGYLAYRSIRNYLAEQGLALVAGEAKVLPTPAQWRALATDGSRMNQLLRDASRVPIDPALEPVALTGNELGLADFMYWSFQIFGMKISSLVFFYYSILLVSAALFLLTFRRSPFCLLLLMLYLAVHYFAVDYANIGRIQTIHNSRFFPVLSLLPAMHLVLLLVRRERASLTNVAAAAAQTFMLFFVVFCRNQAFWQVLAILATAPVMLKFREQWRALPKPLLWPGALFKAGRDTWPALIVLCGLVGLLAYSSHAPDARFYAKESRAHLFWHAFYIEMVSCDPELMSRYGYGEQPHGDNLGFTTVLRDLRGHNEVPKDFATVVDGVLYINVLKNTAEMESRLRRIFFEVIAQHPGLALRSFLIGKPSAQYSMLRDVPMLWDLRSYRGSFIMALAASMLALFIGLGAPERKQLGKAAIALIPIVICSGITTFTAPSTTIPDVIAFYLLLGLVAAIYLPLALALAVAHRQRERLKPGAMRTNSPRP